MTSHAAILALLPMATAEDDWASTTTLALRAGGNAAHTALSAVHAKHSEFVGALALRVLNPRRDLALDAAQDAWIRVARRPAHCRTGAELQAWLRRIAITAAIDVLRREVRRRGRELAAHRHSAPAAQPEHARHNVEEVQQLHQQLESLSTEERAMLDLRFRAQLTIEQIAGIFRIGPAAADSRIRRTLERLRTSRAVEGHQ